MPVPVAAQSKAWVCRRSPAETLGSNLAEVMGVGLLCGPTRAMASSFLRFLDHTQRRITVGRTPLDD